MIGESGSDDSVLLSTSQSVESYENDSRKLEASPEDHLTKVLILGE